MTKDIHKLSFGVERDTSNNAAVETGNLKTKRCLVGLVCSCLCSNSGGGAAKFHRTHSCFYCGPPNPGFCSFRKSLRPVLPRTFAVRCHSEKGDQQLSQTNRIWSSSALQRARVGVGRVGANAATTRVRLGRGRRGAGCPTRETFSC